MSVEAAPGSARTGEDTAALIARLSAEKSTALARLAAGIAHELRNPLAVILARVQLLALTMKGGQPVEPAKLERALKTIEDQATRAARIIESLSIFARPRKPERRMVEIAEIVGQVLGALRPRLAHAASLRTDVQIAADVHAVMADASQLTTALNQLVVNAVEAMPEGGMLRIEARRHLDAVEIAVADTGPGVAARDAERIFDPFFSTKPAAAGLGLCVAQTIAESHGGAVLLMATGGPGVEFVLRLPLER
jgi:two-component system NtrC family sensor kinase